MNVHRQTASAATRGVAWFNIVLGIGLILGMVAISVPGVRRTQNDLARAGINDSVMHVVMAKEYYTLDKGLKPGDAVTMDELTSHGKVITETPWVPAGVEINVGAVGEHVTATWNGATIDPLAGSKPRGGMATQPMSESLAPAPTPTP